MDWFESLTGFTEMDYRETRVRLAVEGRELVSRVTGQRHGIGDPELVALKDLRARARIRVARSDVRRMHHDAAHAGALFQVVSQFNLLEMTGAEVTPEDGVTLRREAWYTCIEWATVHMLISQSYASVARNAQGDSRDWHVRPRP